MVELKGKKLLIATIIGLLAIGALSYTSLPEAYCPLEDSTVKYVHMSDSHKTVTRVFFNGDGDGYQMADDRCQKGRVIGEWIPINKETVKVQNTCKPIIVAYTDNGKYYCESENGKAICTSSELDQKTYSEISE